MKSRVFTTISLLALLLALAAAGTASASPAQDVYNQNNEVLDVVSGGGNAPKPAGGNHVRTHVETGSSTPATPATPTTASSGQLPFTGFQAGLVGLAGLALLGTGFAMRRASRGGSSA